MLILRPRPRKFNHTSGWIFLFYEIFCVYNKLKRGSSGKLVGYCVHSVCHSTNFEKIVVESPSLGIVNHYFKLKISYLAEEISTSAEMTVTVFAHNFRVDPKKNKI